MRDIVSIATTQSDMIEYVRQVSETNNAAMVPEATSSAVIDGTTVTAAMGGLKPESGMVFEKVTTAVKTVAHWMPATKRALADAGQMQNLIDDFLRWGLDEELEDQMVLGNGAGENFEGLTNITNLTAQPWAIDLLVTTRQAKTKVRTVGRMAPTAYLLNPYDWESIQLIRADTGGTSGPFLFGGPAAAEVPTLWNLPVVESESVPQGVGYVGNFRTLVLWDREQANVQITDSHADFFVRNLVAILAEARAAFGCLRPASIVEMDLTPA
jgi:HK97 family phage major capsid protein